MIQRATSKGLICGAGLTIHLITGETIKVNDTEVREAAAHFNSFWLIVNQGVLIPVGEDVASYSADDSISWVLIVEKEVTRMLYCYEVDYHVFLGNLPDIVQGRPNYASISTRSWTHHHGKQ